ncbi:MAG: 1-deoxy-D-xylulose-5-phosphate reductoisomerase, partial [Bacteroidales bacterium]|nr:1-deoxy-D-xylulose-5-phosphate reductoisomerase [Bacteroidales bacterium]
LSYPGRLKSDLPRLDFKASNNLTFFEPDTERFRNLSLAFSALKKGGNMPCILNAANEVAVNSFLSGKTGFVQMSDVVEYTMENTEYIAAPGLGYLESSDQMARETAVKYVNKLQKTI